MSSNKDVGVCSDFDKTQKSNDGKCNESRNGEFIRDEVASLLATDDNTSSKEDEDEDEEIKEDVDIDSEDWDAESVDHVTDMGTVDKDVDNLRDDGHIYDYLIDRSKKCESESDQFTKQQEAVPYYQLIGHRRPRGVKIRRMRERKRAKVNAKLLKAAKYHPRLPNTVMKNAI